MNFKDKNYYIKKIKEILGIIVVCNVTVWFFALLLIYFG